MTYENPKEMSIAGSPYIRTHTSEPYYDYTNGLRAGFWEVNVSPEYPRKPKFSIFDRLFHSKECEKITNAWKYELDSRCDLERIINDAMRYFMCIGCSYGVTCFGTNRVRVGIYHGSMTANKVYDIKKLLYRSSDNLQMKFKCDFSDIITKAIKNGNP